MTLDPQFNLRIAGGDDGWSPAHPMEGVHHLLGLGGIQLVLGTSSSLARLGCEATLGPRLPPPLADLLGDAQAASDFGSAEPLLKQSGRFTSPPLQLRMITGLGHGRSVAEASTIVTLVRNTQ